MIDGGMTGEQNRSRSLRILLVHNSYQHAGGEDSVFRNEAALLEAAGHTVQRLLISNDAIRGSFARANAAFEATYSITGRRLMSNAIRNFQPHVVHVHNFFPRLSAAVFDACASARVASVWTLHNFRVTCANGLLFRDDNVCEDCVGRLPIAAIRHRCYRQSYVGTAAVAASIGYHSVRGTWQDKVQRFIALNDFARDIFIKSGLPAERLTIKANFSHASKEDESASRSGALFVGRLSKEKGVGTLIKAWANIGIPLTVLGEGPERAALEAAAPPQVTFEGFASPDTVSAAMTRAEALIIPSIWYENFPMTLVEAMSAGTPVIVSRLGALERIVDDGVTGLHFKAGDPSDLAKVVSSAFAAPGMLERLGRQAKVYWRENMSPRASLKKLEAIYEEAIAEVDRA